MRSWERFERAATRYEAWYRGPAGLRASRGELRLLDRLLSALGASRSALEIGCGTAHFARKLAERELAVIGMDRSFAMLAEARRLAPNLPLLQGDARRLPLREHSVDLALFIATLEFLDSPAAALAEAVRVARTGVIVIALNRWSSAAVSRRWGRAARGELLPHARDFSLPRLRSLLRGATGKRLQRLSWSSALFPVPCSRWLAPIPLGAVLGLAAALAPHADDCR